MRIASRAASFLVLLSLFLGNCDRLTAAARHFTSDKASNIHVDAVVKLQSLNAVMLKPAFQEIRKLILADSGQPLFEGLSISIPANAMFFTDHSLHPEHISVFKLPGYAIYVLHRILI
jgi:hypothetical protein